MKIDSDIGRFKNIIRNKFKHNLGKFVSSKELIGQQNNKLIKIPINQIDVPRFTFGSNSGPGMGPGDIGDPMGGDKGSGGGKAGDNTSEHDFSAEFTPEELAEIMMEHLELPKLEDKGKGKIHSEKNKYNKISSSGSESLRHGRRTFKEALKRGIIMGDYDPTNPKIIPIKEDKRYKSSSTVETPDVNTVAIFMMDVSGSMQEEQKHIVKSMVFWVELLLNASYKGIKTVFIVHDINAKEINREDFYKISSNGGTKISSAYSLCSEIIEKRYPFSEWNNYVFTYSDGDNLSDQDNELCNDLLNNKLLPNINMFTYTQVRSQDGSGEFINFLGSKFTNNDKVVLSQINESNDLLIAIKDFFSRGK